MRQIHVIYIKLRLISGRVKTNKETRHFNMWLLFMAKHDPVSSYLKFGNFYQEYRS